VSDTPTLALALVAAQADMPAVQRDKINPHFKSRYLSLESLLAEVLPVLNRHGLAVTQWSTFVGDGDGALIPALKTILIHGPSGQAMTETMLLLPTKQDAQGQGAAITYAKRYALMALCGLSADEDDDGNAASKSRTTTAKKTEPKAKPGVVSAAQLTRLHAIVGSVGLSADAAKTIIKAVAGVESSKDIPRDKYDLVIRAIEDTKVAA
jgi:hypothetical protein